MIRTDDYGYPPVSIPETDITEFKNAFAERYKRHSGSISSRSTVDLFWGNKKGWDGHSYGCHAGLAYVAGKNFDMFGSVCYYKNNNDRDEDKRDLRIRFIDYLVNESFLRHAFADKDVEFINDVGAVFRTDINGQYIAAAAMKTRFLTENFSRLLELDRFTKIGVSFDAAFMLSELVKLDEKLITYPNHSFHGSITTGFHYLKNFEEVRRVICGDIESKGETFRGGRERDSIYTLFGQAAYPSNASSLWEDLIAEITPKGTTSVKEEVGYNIFKSAFNFYNTELEKERRKTQSVKSLDLSSDNQIRKNFVLFFNNMVEDHNKKMEAKYARIAA